MSAPPTNHLNGSPMILFSYMFPSWIPHSHHTHGPESATHSCTQQAQIQTGQLGVLGESVTPPDSTASMVLINVNTDR